HIFKDRPRKKANFGQQYCTEGTTFSRVELILRDFSSPDTKVLFVGDGDLCSLALKSKVDFEIHMLDIDREIIRFIENKNTGIITHKINLAKGVPKELHNYFDAIMLDPFWDIKGAEMFINPACECIKKNKLSRIYVCICPLVIGDNYWTLQKMILNKGLVFHEIIKHFNWYELNTDGAYNQVLDIFSDINRKYFKSDLLNNSLNIPYATSDMHILGFL
ncbi:MAG TPA: bis-aminopropyl spermidine synthase family protein, partial [Candidatus Eremiobacteraeota bacterium]|nr:bis-aminopropyl spermidine synthase family protein [Candidatus Eremiobacteraeota bacterium]